MTMENIDIQESKITCMYCKKEEHKDIQSMCEEYWQKRYRESGDVIQDIMMYENEVKLQVWRRNSLIQKGQESGLLQVQENQNV